jgi:hypothetical protein
MPSGLRKGLTSYGDPGFSLFLRKAFIKAKGFSDDALDRPIIGVTDTYSDFNPCHGNVPQLIEAVKRRVMLAGGLPMEFPTVSIHESFSAPTSMYLRNLMSIAFGRRRRAGTSAAVLAEIRLPVERDSQPISTAPDDATYPARSAPIVEAQFECRRYACGRSDREIGPAVREVADHTRERG